MTSTDFLFTRAGFTALILLYILPLAAQPIKKGPWKSLLSPHMDSIWMSVSGAGFPEEGWDLRGGVLYLKSGRKGGDIITRKTYGDFELELEFKLSEAANTGIKYLVTRLRDAKGRKVLNGPEYQLIDDVHHPSVSGGKSPETSTASLYLLYPPEPMAFKGPGKWNRMRIVVRGDTVEHWLNGRRVVQYNRRSPDFKQGIQKTKFRQYAHYAQAAAGHILIQDHGDPAAFRKIRIRSISYATM